VGKPSLYAAQPYAKAEGRVFLLVLAYPGCPGTKAVKHLLLLYVYVDIFAIQFFCGFVVVAYLFLFRLEELGLKEVMKYVKCQNVCKMHLVGLFSLCSFATMSVFIWVNIIKYLYVNTNSASNTFGVCSLDFLF